MDARTHGLGAFCLLAVAFGVVWWHHSGTASAQLVESEIDAGTQLVVMISGQLREKTIGAGIIFGREKDQLYIATANHVVREGSLEAKDLQIRLRSLPDKPLKARLLKHVDQQSDVAVLSVEGLATFGIDICKLRVNRLTEVNALKRGDLVYPVGNPNGVPWGMPVSPDRVAQLVGDNLTFQSSFISVGHSGGALLGNRGELVGMITKDAPPFGLAINIDKVLQVLRGWGYPVELRTANTPSPLFTAVESRDTNEVKRLLRVVCANVNEQYKGFAPLHIAADSGSGPIVELLLRTGAQANVKIDNPRYNRFTPLQSAAEKGHVDVAQLLLNAGADTELGAFSEELTPLALAVNGSHMEVAKLLIRAGAKSDFVRFGKKGQETLLHKAATDGRVDVMKVLIEIGANVNQPAESGRTPLFYAIEKGRIESQIDVVKLLLAGGANVNHKDEWGETPLAMAIVGSWRTESSEKLQWVEIAELLLKAGANIEQESNFTHRPPENMNIRTTRRTGTTPLTLATHYGQVEIVKLLLEAGANVNGTDHEDRTALHHAAAFPSAIPDEGDSVEEAITSKAERQAIQLDLLQVLLQRGANLNTVDRAGDPPLCWALCRHPANGKIKVAEILLKAGARPILNWEDECRVLRRSSRTNMDIKAINDLLQSYAAKQ